MSCLHLGRSDDGWYLASWNRVTEDCEYFILQLILEISYLVRIQEVSRWLKSPFAEDLCSVPNPILCGSRIPVAQVQGFK